MRVDTPRLFLSQDAATLAIALGSDVTLLSRPSGERRSLRAPTATTLVALPASGRHDAAVAGGTELAWVPGSDPARSTELPGRAMFLRQPRDGVVVVLTRSDTNGSFISVLEGDDFEPLVEPVPLGHASAHVLEVDSDHSAVIAGVRGRRAWEGAGDRYLVRVTWRDGSGEIDWNGDGLPVHVADLRARAGRLVAAWDSTIVTSTMEALRADGETDERTLDAEGDVQTLALSPASAALAALIRDGDDVRLVSAGHDDDRLQDRGPLPPALTDLVLALDDHGSVAVAGLGPDGSVSLFGAAPGELVAERWRIEQPRSVWREDD